MKQRQESERENIGTVVSVRGKAVDADFPEQLPRRLNVLKEGYDGGDLCAGDQGHLFLSPLERGGKASL